MYEQTCKGILKGNIGVVCRLIDNLGFTLTVIMLAGRTVTVLIGATVLHATHTLRFHRLLVTNSFIGFSYLLFASGVTYSTGACVQHAADFHLL